MARWKQIYRAIVEKDDVVDTRPCVICDSTSRGRPEEPKREKGVRERKERKLRED